MTKPKRGRVQGPLAPFAAAFWEELAGSSYAVRSAEAHVLLMARLSRWLGQVPLDPGELGPAQVDEFLSWNHAEGYRFPKSARGVMPLLVFLRELGVVPEPPAPALSASEQLLVPRPRHWATTKSSTSAALSASSSTPRERSSALNNSRPAWT